MPSNGTVELTGKRPRLTRAREAAIFKALADPHRFALLQQIAKAQSP